MPIYLVPRESRISVSTAKKFKTQVSFQNLFLFHFWSELLPQIPRTFWYSAILSETTSSFEINFYWIFSSKLLASPQKCNSNRLLRGCNFDFGLSKVTPSHSSDSYHIGARTKYPNMIFSDLCRNLKYPEIQELLLHSETNNSFPMVLIFYGLEFILLI